MSIIAMARGDNALAAFGATDYLPAETPTQNGASPTNIDPSNPANNIPWGATLISQAGKIDNMYYIGARPGIGTSFTGTYMLNGISTPLKVIVLHANTDGHGNGIGSDLVHSFNVAEGDLIAVQWANSVAGGATTGSISCRFTPN